MAAAQTKEPKTFEISIDGDSHDVSEREMTAGAILGLAGKSSDAYYLVEKRGRKERDSYKDPEQLVKLHPGSDFITVSTGETPVS